LKTREYWNFDDLDKGVPDAVEIGSCVCRGWLAIGFGAVDATEAWCP
jgi:hypothetical protein